MGKWQIDAMLDAALQYLEDNATIMTVCSAQPANYAEATTTYDGGASKYKIADIAIDSSDFTGPADGTTNGRKTTINQQADVPVDATATATHIALSSGTTLLYVTTCTSQALTSGNTVTIPAWSIEIADAT